MPSLSRLELLNAVLSGLQSVVDRLDLDRDRKPPALLWFLETLETLLVVEAVQDTSCLYGPLVSVSHCEACLLDGFVGRPVDTGYRVGWITCGPPPLRTKKRRELRDGTKVPVRRRDRWDLNPRPSGLPALECAGARCPILAVLAPSQYKVAGCDLDYGPGLRSETLRNKS